MINMRLVRTLAAAGVEWKAVETYAGVQRLRAYDVGTDAWIDLSGWTETKLARWVRASKYVKDPRNELRGES